MSTQFTLVPGKGGEPMISPHLAKLRPFLTKGDFKPGAWGHALVDELAPADLTIEKIAYSAFYMTRLEWVLRKGGIEKLFVAGIVTNGGVASTVRDAHVRDFETIVLRDGCAAFTPGSARHRHRCVERRRPHRLCRGSHRGGRRRMSSVLPTEDIAFESVVPVLIVGGGAAGLCAALAAHEAGADCVVLERDAVPRGSTRPQRGIDPCC